MKQSNSLISLNIFNIIKQFFNIIQIIQIASKFFQLFAFFDQDPNKIHTLQLIFALEIYCENFPLAIYLQSQ